MNIKAVLFARVSTREQAEEGYSLQAQERLLNDYAGQKELLVVKRFSVPESASGEQERKLFNELLNYLFDHTQVKVVICEKVDRITRNLKDAVKIDDWLIEDEERQIHFVKQNLIIHKNSKSNDKFMWDIHLAVARQYSNNLSEETKKGLFEKANEGWYPGNHKRGYKSIGDRGHKVWVVDEDAPDWKYLEMAFVMFNTGNYTLRTLSQELYKQGWNVNRKQISISELHNLLRDPFYCGQFIWREKLYKNAKHKGIVSEELFYSVQERLQRKVKAGKFLKHEFTFGGGLMVCGECDRTITWDKQKGHAYGHCTRYKTDCSQRKYVREEIIEEQVIQILDGFIIRNPKVLDWVRKALKESHKYENDYYTDSVRELETRKQRIEKRMSVLYDDRIDGRVTKEFYDKKQKQYEGELENVIEATEKHSKANIDYYRLGINLFELSQKGAQLYQKMALLEEKREFLNFVFSNLRLKNEKVYPGFKNGFQVIAKRAEDGNWLRGMDSNHRTHLQRVVSYR